MYLVERIIREIEQGESEQAQALRALMPGGTVEAFADFSLENPPLPYISVIEGETTMEEEGSNHKWRMEKTPISFHVFAGTRQQAADITEALDNLFQVAELDDITGREVLSGSPFFEGRLPVWKRDNWQSNLSYYWLTQKRFLRA